MALKFRKKIRVFPGFYLNLSKSGMSATVGMKGLSVNIGKKGTYLNTGIPGTGIYDRQKIGDSLRNENFPHPDNEPFENNEFNDDTVEIKSYDPALTTSEGLFGLKESIINAQKVKKELYLESKVLHKKYLYAKFLLIFSYISLYGFIFKWFKENYISKKQFAEEAEQDYKNFKLDIQFNLDSSILKEYEELKINFEKVKTSEKIWDITTSKSVDMIKERSAANKSLSRIEVKFSFSILDFINSDYQAIKFQNANGGDLLIYPGFLVIVGKKESDFGLIDFRDLQIEHSSINFLETDSTPKDANIVGYTWKYVNKNGSPDKRYKDNYQIPIAMYYALNMKSNTGLFESFHFSNHEAGLNFP